MKVFLCENSPDGIFTGIYEAWGSGAGHKNLRLEIEENINYELFAEYINVNTDGVKAGKVARTIRKRLGEMVWHDIFQAALADEAGKAEAIYQTVVIGLDITRGREGAAERLMENLKEPCIFQVFSLSRAVGHEAHRYLGFVRFREMKGGFLFAEISPSAQVLPLIGDHFENRYPKENFVIYDSRHGVYLVHRADQPWVLFWGEKLNSETLKETEGELFYASLWRCFVDTIEIKERKSERLQKQLLPLKFRRYMTEYFLE